jgi:glycosyltransferase involved in cell wall biosynthesis
MDIRLISRYFDETGSRFGGVETYSKLIYDGFKNENNINIEKISFNDIKFPLPYEFKYFIFPMLWRKSRDFDITHILYSDLLYSNVSLDKFKSVVTVHDLIPLKFPNTYNFFYKNLFFKSLKNTLGSKKIIVTSKETKEDIIHFGADCSKVEVIRPIISHNYFPKENNNDKFTVGTISRLDWRKRIGILIKHFKKANIKNSKLLIGGTGPELQSLKKLAGNDSRIQFLGFIPNVRMNDFYNSLDVFVFPTMVEGYGLPIIEAMGCGKPVVTLEDASIPSDIKEKTHIIQNNSLYQLLKEKKFNCNIKNNLKFFNKHSQDICTKKLIKTYQSI